MSRPQKIAHTPDGRRESILRAVLPEWFPPNMGWMLFSMFHCRDMIERITKEPERFTDILRMINELGGVPRSIEDMLEDFQTLLTLEQSKLERLSRIAIRGFDEKHFMLITLGMEHLKGNGRDEYIRRAVAEAWWIATTHDSSPPKPGIVATIANGILPKDTVIETKEVCKLLDGWKMPRAKQVSRTRES